MESEGFLIIYMHSTKTYRYMICCSDGKNAVFTVVLDEGGEYLISHIYIYQNPGTPQLEAKHLSTQGDHSYISRGHRGHTQVSPTTKRNFQGFAQRTKAPTIFILPSAMDFFLGSKKMFQPQKSVIFAVVDVWGGRNFGLQIFQGVEKFNQRTIQLTGSLWAIAAIQQLQMQKTIEL